MPVQTLGVHIAGGKTSSPPHCRKALRRILQVAVKVYLERGARTWYRMAWPCHSAMISAPVRIYRLYSYVEYSCPVKTDGHTQHPACLPTSRPHAGTSCCCPHRLVPPSSTLHSLSKRPSPTTLHSRQLRMLGGAHSESGHHLNPGMSLPYSQS